MPSFAELMGRLQRMTLYEWAIAIFILLGILFRLSFMQDVEYKEDEHWTFTRSQMVGTEWPWPAVGMVSSARIHNPGLSIWSFVLLAKITQASTPVGLSRAVAICNILAILLFVRFIFNSLPKKSREPWLWGMAIASVSPVVVLFHRKIWAQSITPIFCVLTYASWWNRDRKWPAFFWGLGGAFLGQIHLGGFFTAFCVFLGTLGLQKWNKKKTKWSYWIAGSVVGALGLLPWFRHVIPKLGNRGDGHHNLNWIWNWLRDSVSYHVDIPLGRHLTEFHMYPLVADSPTYLGAALRLGTIGVGMLILAGFLWRLPMIWGSINWKSQIANDEHLLRNLLFLFPPVVFLAGGIQVHNSYLVLAFPIVFVMLAQLAFIQRKAVARSLLVVFCLLSAGLTSTFQSYIHENKGARYGDYGVAYQHQVNKGKRAQPLD